MNKLIYLMIGLIMIASALAVYDSAGSTIITDKQPNVYAPGKGNMVLNKNVAVIMTRDTDIVIDNFEAKSNTEVNINIQSSSDYSLICFQFPVRTDKIVMHNVYSKQDLKRFEQVNDYSICYGGVTLGDTVTYTPEYNGADTIKYNITLGDKVIDPYIVGSLSVSNLLSLYIPFNGSIAATWNSIETPLNSSSTRTQVVPDGVATTQTGTGCNNAANGYDNDFNTYATTNGGTGSCVLNIFYNKQANDTGLIWEVKDNSGYINLSIPSNCFNYYAANVSLLAYIYTTSGVSQITYYCYYAGWQTLSVSNNALFYEGEAIFTNQSNFVAYYQRVVPTALVNTLGLNAGYVFAVENSSKDLTGNHNGIDTAITYNSSGANMNGTGSRINLTNTIDVGNSNADFSAFVNYRLNKVNPYTAQHIVGSTASGWQKGWQIVAVDNLTEFLCTSTSGVTGYVVDHNVNNLVGQHSVAVVVRNVLVLP